MNLNRARASAIKHSMQFSAAMSSDNPYHGQHIQQFCEYADAVAEGAAEDIKKEIPNAVKDEVKRQLSSNQVEIQIDKQSFKKAQKAIEGLFNPFKRWKK